MLIQGAFACTDGRYLRFTPVMVSEGIGVYVLLEGETAVFQSTNDVRA